MMCSRIAATWASRRSSGRVSVADSADRQHRSRLKSTPTSASSCTTSIPALGSTIRHEHAVGQRPARHQHVDASAQLGIPLPPLPEQRAIAHILGTLDDKIELNRRMNETLEAMARALFKSWFVDFDPVRAKAEGRDPGLPKPLADLFPARLVDSELGEIPEGWRPMPLGDVLSNESERRIGDTDAPDVLPPPMRAVGELRSDRFTKKLAQSNARRQGRTEGLRWFLRLSRRVLNLYRSMDAEMRSLEASAPAYRVVRDRQEHVLNSDLLERVDANQVHTNTCLQRRIGQFVAKVSLSPRGLLHRF